MKKNNTIKRLGLEKEFKNWVRDIRSKDKFKYGDRVELINPKLYAGIEKGEYGTVFEVRKIDKDIILRVEFDEKPGTEYNWYSSRFKVVK